MRPYTEERCEGKLSCTVLDWRWGGRPPRRPYGKLRGLGLPTWSDKLLQEVIRLILEAYYEPQFSSLSHGFRPGRGCHTALTAITDHWNGTKWFIEGDISQYFDTVDHTVLVTILGEKLKDNRFLRLISNLLRAGYLEDWKYHRTLSGSPQGGVVSPILSNIYLDKFDTYVEQVLIPEYTRGTRRRYNLQYEALRAKANRWKKKGKRKEAQKLWTQVQRLPSRDPSDPDYRRLKYVRYADDVRHLTQYEILLAEKGGSEDDDLWVISPTWTRKPKGKGACEKRGKRAKALKRCPARPA